MTLPSRRTFLGATFLGAAAAGAAVALPARPAGATPVAAVPRGGYPVLTGPFPRAVAFRQAEVLSTLRGYDAWAAAFEPLGGFVAKLLQEERTDTVIAATPQYAARYAREHPSALVVLHYNGRARRPGYRTAGWSASDWLTFAGTAVTGPLTADATTVDVADTGVVDLEADLQGRVEADLVVTARLPDGRPDWTTAEYVVLTAVTPGVGGSPGGSLTVRRGAYGSTPRAFDAGAYVAQLLSAGPWSAQDTRLWFYNLATTAVRGPDGRSVTDRIVAEFAADLGRGGPLAGIGGMELDVFSLADSTRPFVDADGDGVADGAVSGGVDRYREGQAVLTAALRGVLGTGRVLAVDSGLQLPDPTSVCGVELEGFPTLEDPAARQWSQALAALVRWTATGARPRMTYPLAKTRPPADLATQARRLRLAVAATLVAGCELSFWDEPTGTTSLTGLLPGETNGQFLDTFTVWDEILGGDLRTAGWLGTPVADAVRPADAAADLWAGGGVRATPAWVGQLATTGAAVTRLTAPAGIRVTPTTTAGWTLTLPPVTATGSDLTLVTEVTADDDAVLTVTLGAGGASTQRFAVGRAPTRLPVTAGATTGRPTRAVLTVDTPVTLTVRRTVLRPVADTAFRRFTNGAVCVNPGTTPATFDLAALAPGVAYRRLRATPGQPAGVNDGSAVTAGLTVPPADAIVLVADGT